MSKERLSCGCGFARVGVGLRTRHFTGASDDDPSGISTYSIAGASTGYSMLWTALLTTPMMAVVQGMCARIGLVCGCGLTTALARRFPAAVVRGLVILVVLANTLNIGADIAGMGASAHLFSRLFRQTRGCARSPL